MNRNRNYFLYASFFILGDLTAIALAATLSFAILTSFAVTQLAVPLIHVVLYSTFSIISLAAFRMYQVSWRFTSLRELLFISLGLASGFTLSITTLLIAGLFSSHYFLFLLLVFLTSILTVGGFRISKRMLNEVLRPPVQRKRVVIFGAGNAADQLLRDFTRHHHWSINVVAIFDDNEKLHGLTLHGIRIMGDRKKMYSFLRYSDIDELIVAIPSMSKMELKGIIEAVNSHIANLKVKVLPSYHLLSDDPVGFNDIRRISIEDVLGREPVRVKMKELENYIADRRILITGAGGSIGSEIVRQTLSLHPAQVVALDIDETELFYLNNDYSGFREVFEPCVANVTDEDKMRKVFEIYRPEIIFHAAAYKHVPMMEKFPEEAIKTNIGGTQLLSKLCVEYGVDKFVLISTDKAVNPANVMGATKRAAEEICLSYNKWNKTRFFAVRFGNVLGSRGSVVPIFIDQIQNGGPITITHKDIKRYFMTIPEAVLLVLQAGAIGEGGEVYLLDMGEPVKILDMANQLIRLHGLQPGKDIQIEFTGLRPGEKMFEELHKHEEVLESTVHPLINKVRCEREMSLAEVEDLVNRLLHSVQNGSSHKARIMLKELVPNYIFKVQGEFLAKEVI